MHLVAKCRADIQQKTPHGSEKFSIDFIDVDPKVEIISEPWPQEDKSNSTRKQNVQKKRLKGGKRKASKQKDAPVASLAGLSSDSKRQDDEFSSPGISFDEQRGNINESIKTEAISDIEIDYPSLDMGRSRSPSLALNAPPPTAPPAKVDVQNLPAFLISIKSGEKRIRQFQCDICKKFLLTKTTLTSHMKLKHRSPDDAIKSNSVCDVCGRVCSTPGNLKIHKTIHTNVKNFICSFCGKGFRVKFHMTEHMNSHTGLKPYKCTICEKSFYKRSLLDTHKRIHTGYKPYKCSIEGCERTYAHSIDLKRHLWGQHRIYTKKYECPICSKIFSENKLLTKHLKTHP